ncbi:clavesin-2-like [Culicoides brevitarsis]|uniref:clavesin-2-like n=1 Tax=Culicoides brevitarsis TaxID=469753 RepID=UPI00307C7DFB
MPLINLISTKQVPSMGSSDVTVAQTAAKAARKELRETEDAKKVGLSQMTAWIKNNPDIEDVQTDENFLLRFLRVKKFNVPLAEQMLLKYLNLKKTLPHLTAHLDFLSPSLNEIINEGYMFPSPCRDKNGRRVIIGIAKNFNAHKYTSSDMAKVHFLTYETLLCEPTNQILGFTHIGDFNGLSVSHVTMWNPTEFSRILKWAEQSVPMRHKEIHLVNVGAGVKWIIDVGKSRTSKKMQERLQVHANPDDLKKKFSPEILPVEMGGSKYTIQEMIQLWREELAMKRDEIMALDRMKIIDDRGIIGRRHDQGHKGNKKLFADSVIGNFRKLELD